MILFAKKDESDWKPIDAEASLSLGGGPRPENVDLGVGEEETGPVMPKG